MALIRTQALVSVSVPGYSLKRAAGALQLALVPYADARVIALTRSTNWGGAFFGSTDLLAVVEFTPTA